MGKQGKNFPCHCTSSAATLIRHHHGAALAKHRRCSAGEAPRSAGLVISSSLLGHRCVSYSVIDKKSKD
ncbi:hypothetical protein TIFTF001_033155 [Ficus carica]|uniref:Uncharacterized protein n=1 Tax=Ficus carica TaxID=3494 RepID=A0AA88DYC2_FICCA|nr:hypothetical protein TIFTF001_033155 [Ficus carica]